MTRIRCFEPVGNTQATTLILGSMPGKESLRAGQYYAHPRNSFWPILGDLVGAEPALPYEDRIRALQSAEIALWDVLESCARATSLDSDIENDSVVPNDFAWFFSTHQKITRVFFNGAKAEHCYRKHVLPVLKQVSIVYKRLPSTSPANASISFERKLTAWKAIVEQGPTICSTRTRATTARRLAARFRAHNMKIKFQKAWKFYFWFSLVGLAAGLLLEFKMETVESTFTDVALNISGYIIGIVELICLYGFAWQVRFGRRIFWTAFFFVSLGFFGYTMSDAMLSDVEDVLSSNFFVISLVILILLIFLLQTLANYLYAFRSKHLWTNVP